MLTASGASQGAIGGVTTNNANLALRVTGLGSLTLAANVKAGSGGIGIESAAGITETSTVAGKSLTVSAAGPVSMLGANTISTLAAQVTGSGNSFALNVIGDEGTLDRMAGLAGTLLQKDVRLIVDLAEQVATRAGAVLDAADAALTLMDHPR